MVVVCSAEYIIIIIGCKTDVPERSRKRENFLAGKSNIDESDDDDDDGDVDKVDLLGKMIMMMF